MHLHGLVQHGGNLSCICCGFPVASLNRGGACDWPARLRAASREPICQWRRARPSSGPAACPPWWPRSQIEREHACEASGAPQVSDLGALRARSIRPILSPIEWIFYRFAHTQQCAREIYRCAKDFFSDTSLGRPRHRFFPLLDTPPAQIFWPDGQKIIKAPVCTAAAW